MESRSGEHRARRVGSRRGASQLLPPRRLSSADPRSTKGGGGQAERPHCAQMSLCSVTSALPVVNILPLWCRRSGTAAKAGPKPPPDPPPGSSASPRLARGVQAALGGDVGARSTHLRVSGGGAPAHRPGHARGAARGGTPPEGLSFAARITALSCARPFRLLPPLPQPHHGAGVGGRGPAEPLPGGLCGEPEQVPAEAGHLGR